MSLPMRPIEPIKRKRTQAIKKNSHIFRINVLGYPVLKHKQIALKNHHYDFIRMPDIDTDYEKFQKKLKEDLRINEDFLGAFLSPLRERFLKEFYLYFLFSKEREMSQKTFFLKNQEELMKNVIKDSWALSFYQSKEVLIGGCKFTRVFENRFNYYTKDDIRMLANVEAWGMHDKRAHLIEIVVLFDQDFEILKETPLKGGIINFLATEQPIVFYTLQMKLLCSGLSKGIFYFVNRNSFESLVFLVEKDENSYEFLFKISREHEKILSLLKNKNEKEAIEFLDNHLNSLKFKEALNFPYGIKEEGILWKEK